MLEIGNKAFYKEILPFKKEKNKKPRIQEKMKNISKNLNFYKYCGNTVNAKPEEIWHLIEQIKNCTQKTFI